VERIAELRDALEARSREIRAQGAQASRGLLEQAESLWSELTRFLSRKASSRSRRRSTYRLRSTRAEGDGAEVPRCCRTSSRDTSGRRNTGTFGRTTLPKRRSKRRGAESRARSRASS